MKWTTRWQWTNSISQCSKLYYYFYYKYSQLFTDLSQYLEEIDKLSIDSLPIMNLHGEYGVKRMISLTRDSELMRKKQESSRAHKSSIRTTTMIMKGSCWSESSKMGNRKPLPLQRVLRGRQFCICYNSAQDYPNIEGQYWEDNYSRNYNS